MAELTFTLRDEPLEDPGETLNLLLGALRMNGQVIGDTFPIAESPTGYVATVMLPEATALAHEHNGFWVTRRYVELDSLGISLVDWRVIGEDPASAEPCSCSSPTWYILYTNYVALESSLKCGDDFLPVPLYRVPPTADDEYHDLISWQSDYRACDTLYMNSRTGERFALRELSSWDSSLARQGRSVCDKITEATGRPTYYYLLRTYARSGATERERRCPSCGGEWWLEERLHDKFDFRCERCRLLSNLAWNAPERS